jgi:hypothetical protein
MPEPDLRGILAAFAEKKWVVYEVAGREWNAFDGPVDNLKQGVEYRIMPAAENPADLEAAAQELSDMVNHGSVFPSFEMGEGRHIDVSFFVITPSHFIAEPKREHLPFPIDEAEGLIRDYFTTYDREATRKRVEKAVRDAEAMKERRRQRRRQNDEGYLRSWIESVTGGKDE